MSIAAWNMGGTRRTDSGVGFLWTARLATADVERGETKHPLPGAPQPIENWYRFQSSSLVVGDVYEVVHTGARLGDGVDEKEVEDEDLIFYPLTM